MNKPFEVDEPAAIRELCSLSRNARLYLGDKVRNALTPIVGVCECELSDDERSELINKSADVIVNVLKGMRC